VFLCRAAISPRGITVELIEAAVKFAKRGGAGIVEGYPVEPNRDKQTPLFTQAWLQPFEMPVSRKWRAGRRRVPSCGPS